MNAAGRARRNATRSEKRRAAARRRAELAAAARRPTAAAPARRTGRRRLVAGVGIVVALALITLGLFLVWPEDEPDLVLRAKKVADTAPEQTLTETPATYRITYRVESGPKGATLEQQILVRRPYDMRYRFANEGQLDDALFDTVLTKTRKTERTSSSGPATTAERSTPVLLPFGTRLDATLADLVARGLYVRRERRTLLGVECTVYRTGAEVEGGTVIKPTADSWTDVCITDDALMVDEVSVSSGQVNLRATATSVERAPAVTDADFPVVDDETELTTGGVVVVDLPVTAAPTSPYWQPSTVPQGWTLASRQRVEVAKADTETTGPTATRTSWVDVYTRGNDLVTVRQGAAGQQPATIDTSQGEDATAGTLGAGKLVVSTTGTRFVVENTNGRFVQLAGTVSVQQLEAFAAALAVG